MFRQGKFHPPNLEKTVDNSPHIGYNIPCQQPADIQKVKILGICIVVVRQTLTLFVGVRFSHPQPNPTAAQSAAVFSGHSAAGSAPGSGLGGRGFKSRCSDQKTNVERHSSFFVCPQGFCEKLTYFTGSFSAKSRNCGGGPLLSLQGRAGVLKFKTLSLYRFSVVKAKEGRARPGAPLLGGISR